MAQGKAQGMAQGKAEGEALAEERLVRAMASNGLDAATIANATNLPVERVKKILG
jgi:predicted transposase YdaD